MHESLLDFESAKLANPDRVLSYLFSLGVSVSERESLCGCVESDVRHD